MNDAVINLVAAGPQVANAGRYEAFISYAREDRVFANRLATVLEGHGMEVWLDVDDIVGGEDWHARVKRGIEACKAFVFILSPDSLSSPPCRQELDQAAALNKLIVPVHYCPLDEDKLPAVPAPFSAVRGG